MNLRKVFYQYSTKPGKREVGIDFSGEKGIMAWKGSVTYGCPAE